MANARSPSLPRKDARAIVDKGHRGVLSGVSSSSPFPLPANKGPPQPQKNYQADEEGNLYVLIALRHTDVNLNPSHLDLFFSASATIDQSDSRRG